MRRLVDRLRMFPVRMTSMAIDIAMIRMGIPCLMMLVKLPCAIWPIKFVALT